MPGGDGEYDVHNPARPAEVVGRAPAADATQVDAAVTAARAAAPGWAAVPWAERVKAVVDAATKAGGYAEQVDLPSLYTREHGKVRSEAAFEFAAAPAIAMILGGLAEQALAAEHPDGSAYPRLQREPFGVAALILPFNWPVATLMTKISAALAAGNTAVVKVPPTCPLAVLAFGAVIADELPPGVLNLIAGPGSAAGERLVGHPGVDIISVTGGLATGRAVMASAAANLTPVLLELGGNDAAIIAPDLPITEALADQLAAAAYTTGGQVCMAAKRVYVPRSRVGELSEALHARCDREVVGDGLADGVTFGPLHTRAGRDRVVRLVDDARERGATVVAAGQLRPEDAASEGYFVLPTVVTGIAPGASLVTEEQFGPVLPILGYDEVDDAVAAANATEFGLTASVWTGDDELADRVVDALVAGTVSVNCHGMAAQDPRLPFGGFRSSGLGRELGVDGVRAFTQPRSFIKRPPPS